MKILQGKKMNPNQVPILGFEILESIKGQIYYSISFDLEQVIKSMFSICQKHLYLGIGNALIFFKYVDYEKNCKV